MGRVLTLEPDEELDRIGPDDLARLADPQAMALASLASDEPPTPEAAPAPPPPVPMGPAESAALSQMQAQPEAPRAPSAMELHTAAPYPMAPPPAPVPSVIDTDALSAANGGSVFARDEVDQTPVTSAAADYGADGMRQMQHAIDGGGARDLAQPQRTLARDDAEPLGSVARYGSHAGQMFAPSGAGESVDQRWARLAAGGDFSGNAIAPVGGVAPALDEAEAVDNPREEAMEPPPGAPRLDDGLPTEARIASERSADPWRHLLHNIGNALRVAAGRSSTGAYEDRGGALATQRATGLHSAQMAKGQERRAEQTAQRQEERQAASDALAQQRLGLQERGVRATEALIPERQAAMRASTERTEAQTQHILSADEVARLQREGDSNPDSGESRSARLGFLVGISRLPPQMRDRIIAESGLDMATVGGASARDLSVANEMIRRISVGARGGTGEGRTGGSGGGRDALMAAAARLHIAPEVAEALPTEDLRRLVATEGGQEADAAREAAPDDATRPVVWADAGGRSITVDPRLFDSTVEIRNYRDGLATAGDLSGYLAEIDRVYADATRGADTPAARAAAFARLQASGALDQPTNLLLGAMTEMARTGVINPGPEADRLRSMIPDPGSVRQMAFGQYQERMEQFRESLRQSIERRARQRGVSADDIGRLMGELGLGHRTSHPTSAALPTPDAPSSTTTTAGAAFAPVALTLPNGRTATARTQAALDAALAQGARRAE